MRLPEREALSPLVSSHETLRRYAAHLCAQNDALTTQNSTLRNRLSQAKRKQTEVPAPLSLRTIPTPKGAKQCRILYKLPVDSREQCPCPVSRCWGKEQFSRVDRALPVQSIEEWMHGDPAVRKR